MMIDDDMNFVGTCFQVEVNDNWVEKMEVEKLED
jgi:hypothetical protein